jgi:predicted dehydrogenase
LTAPAVLVAPVLVPAAVLGQAKRPAPGNRIVLAALGVGVRGTANLKSFLAESDCQVVAVCDVDKLHAEDAKDLVNRHYQNQDCRVYYDFRQLLARADLDAVSLALPSHWHAIPALWAARSGLDLYGETPLAHNLREGRAICDTVRRYARIWQTGSWQRSVENFRCAAELVLNGRIGKVRKIEVGLPAGHPDLAGTAGQEEPSSPPPQLDYEFWLGPAPWAPYCPARVHQNWRWHRDYGGGQLLDWVGHHVDLAHWGMGWDQTGPVEVEGQGEYPASGLWNTATKYRLTCKYAQGVTLVIAGGYPEVRSGTRWIGESGWVWCDREGLATEPKRLRRERIASTEITLPRSPGHHRNFLDCVKSRGTPLAPAETAHRSTTPGHLGLIALLLGRKLYWNPETEQIAGDPTATRLLGRAMREPWRLG